MNDEKAKRLKDMFQESKAYVKGLPGTSMLPHEQQAEHAGVLREMRRLQRMLGDDEEGAAAPESSVNAGNTGVTASSIVAGISIKQEAPTEAEDALMTDVNAS